MLNKIKKAFKALIQTGAYLIYQGNKNNYWFMLQVVLILALPWLAVIIWLALAAYQYRRL